MNKSTDIFILEKWWGKRITLIVATFVLAGCQSQVIPSTATATSTSTEIPATATLMPTNTPEPTATATELVLPDNAVEIVGGGYAYVESGKLMLLGADGVAKEVKDPSYDVVFNTMDDAKNIFKKLNPEATNVTREDFFPGGYPSAGVYKMVMDSSANYDFSDGSGAKGFRIVGISKDFARVKNPVDFPGFPDLGVAFLAVNGYSDLLPVPMGAFGLNGEYSSMMGSATHMMPQDYTSNNDSKPSFDPIFFIDHTWDKDQAALAGKILCIRTTYSVPPEAASTFSDNPRLDMDASIPPELLPLRDALIRFQGMTMGELGHAYTNSDDAEWQTGAMLEAVDDLPDGSFFVYSLRGAGPVMIIETGTQ